MSDSQSTFNLVIWFLILIFLSYWVACFCFVPYLVVSIFQPCIPDLKPLADILLKGIAFPHLCSDNMINRRGLDCR